VTIFTNGYEGTSGTAVTAANSGGSGTAFNAVTNNINYTNVRTAHGSTSAVSLAATGSPAYAAWTLAGESAVSGRIYYYVSTAVNADIWPMELLDNSSAGQVFIRLTSTGFLRIMGPAQTNLWTSTQAVPSGQFVRIGFYVNQATNQFRCAMFSGDSTTAIADSGVLTGSAGALGTTGFYSARQGVANNCTFTGTMGWDDAAIYTGADASSSLIGPVTTGTPGSVTCSAGTNQVGVEPWTAVTLAGTDADTGGTITTRAWTQTAGATVTLSGASTATATYTAPATIAGDTATFQYKVTDSTAASATSTVQVTTLPVTERAVIGGVEVPMQVRVT
jgi:hypothetical protein